MIHALQIRFDQSRWDPKDTFECALEKLKILEEKICENMPAKEKQFLIARNLKHKLMTDKSYIPKNVQIALERLES